MGATDQPDPRRRRRIAIALLGIVLLLVVGLRMALEPQRASGLLLASVGAALGLDIEAHGSAEYHLRGTPTLVLRDVVAREPGAATALLRADRMFFSLPWSTLRARGARLAADRLELDGVSIDLPAMQRWLATRPPSRTRLLSLSRGMRIRDGKLHGDGWNLDDIQLDLPMFAPEAPLHAHLRGRYVNPPLAIPADLNVAIVRPAALLASTRTGFAIAGTLTVSSGTDWRMSATVIASGPLSLNGNALRIDPARIGIAATHASGATRLPFSLGAHGVLLFRASTWLLGPARFALRGRGQATDDPIPTLDAGGHLAVARRLVLGLDGRIARWPKAWPALPAPLSSDRPLPFSLDYAGATDLSGVASLQLQHEAATLQARLRLPQLQGWLAHGDTRDPLPPLDASVHARQLDVAGAHLEGVELFLDDTSTPDLVTTPDATR